MKTPVLFLGLTIALAVVAGAQTKTTVTGSGVDSGQVLTYQGPKARLAVGRFEVKAAKAYGEVGEGVSDMLVDALFRTNRFIILEKGDALRDLEEEFNLGERGMAKTAPEKGTFETADVILVGAITAFEPQYQGVGGGGIVIPLPWKLGGGIAVKKDEAYIAATIRLADVRTRRILNSVRVEGLASKFKIGGGGGALIGSVILAGGMSKYKNTPMEQAVMVMLDNAVTEVVKSVPEDYYRHGSGAPAAAATGGADEIIGGASSFRAGKTAVLEETFAKYDPGDIPAGWGIKADTAEAAKYKDRVWLRFLETASASRKVAWPDECSLEFSVYLSSAGSALTCIMDNVNIALGGGNTVIVGAKSVAADLKGAVHAVGVSRKGGKVRVYVDDKQVFQGSVDEVAGKTPPSGLLKFTGTVDRNAKVEALVTGIKAAGY